MSESEVEEDTEGEETEDEEVPENAVCLVSCVTERFS